jgi:hypothetical protein
VDGAALAGLLARHRVGVRAARGGLAVDDAYFEALLRREESAGALAIPGTRRPAAGSPRRIPGFGGAPVRRLTITIGLGGMGAGGMGDPRRPGGHHG